MDIEIGSWGLYPWFEEHGTGLIHPEDLAEFRMLKPYGLVFNCVSNEGTFLLLRYGEKNYRVFPQLFKPVPSPKFTFGQKVSFEKDGNVFFGLICEIRWHNKNSKPFFHLILDGKRLSKQYWENELFPVLNT